MYAAAQDVTPFAATSGHCVKRDYENLYVHADFPTQPLAHPQVVVRLDTTAGSGDFFLYPGANSVWDSNGTDFGGADVTWAGVAEIKAGATPSVGVACAFASSDFDFRAALYDVPT